MVDVAVDVVWPFGAENVALERTVFAFPHGFGVVHSSRNFIDGQSLPPLGSDGPGTFAKAPVVVVTVGSSGERLGIAFDSASAIVLIPELIARRVY